MPNDLLTDLRFNAEACELKEMRDKVRADLGYLVDSNEIMDRIVLAINEACMNIIQHAYRPQSRGEIQLQISRNHKGIVIRIIDSADPIDISTIKSRALDDLRPGGLGVHFIRSVMDHVEYSHQTTGVGNILEMHKYL